MRELELYLHIPFCAKKCNYCDFLSAPADEESQSAYMESLEREIAYYGRIYQGTAVSTIYIGGGTPSILPEYWIKSMMERIEKCFFILPDAEITIECNPGTLTKNKLLTYRSCGINRLSMGLQSADNEELKLLGRIHTYEQFCRNYEMARECGYTNINVDLMNALPGQTVEKFYGTLEKVMGLRPEHISAYTLMIEKGTPFYETYKFDAVSQEAGMQTTYLPDEETSYQIGKVAQQYLEENGYDRYEISNYALPGYECRHNTGYWKRKEYLGMGLGASSLLQNARYQNRDDILGYCEDSKHITGVGFQGKEGYQTVNGCCLHQFAEWIPKDARIEEFMFLGLRMAEGIKKSSFYHEFGFAVSSVYGKVIPGLIREGLLAENATHIMLTDKGSDLSNYVLAYFLLE